MFSRHFSRRDFLKLSGITLGGLALRPSFDFGELEDHESLVRVATDQVSVHLYPDEESLIKYQVYRDELLNVYYELESDKKPRLNPRWYRIWGGYVHCKHMQPVKVILNQVPKSITNPMTPIEITVPYTQSWFQKKPNEWSESYRLYYDTVHYCVGVEEGPDGEGWYRVRDEMLDYSQTLDYFIPAKHARPVPAEDMAPLAIGVSPDKKRIEVSLEKQELTAFEDGKVVLKTKISSGLNFTPADGISYNTPTGKFNIETKMMSKHMGEVEPYMNYHKDAYVLPGVSWTSFFEMKNGVAFHGTYWHQNFGSPMSHGCINMKTEEARWLFRWTTPLADISQMSTNGFGTQVEVY